MVGNFATAKFAAATTTGYSAVGTIGSDGVNDNSGRRRLPRNCYHRHCGIPYGRRA
jgi:hypothetical protein